MSVEIVKERLLVVEGEDERHFFEALAAAIEVDLQVLPIGGKTRVRENLGLLVISPGFNAVRAVGVVRDADENYDAAFQSVADALDAAGLMRPAVPEVIAEAEPRTGVFVVPGVQRVGAIEHLCRESVASEAAAPCVNAYFDCLDSRGIRHASAALAAKAWVQVFLASKPEPGKQLGVAAKAGYWLFGAASFDPLKQFLRALGT